MRTTFGLVYHLIGDGTQSDAMHKPTSSMGMVCDDVLGIRAIDAAGEGQGIFRSPWHRSGVPPQWLGARVRQTLTVIAPYAILRFALFNACLIDRAALLR